MYSGALKLLENYGGDSSDDDVPSGRVSTKRCFRSDSDEDTPKSRLPPPILSLKMEIKKEEVVNNPEQHEGKIRTFPHERGNWSTYVYIPYEGEVDLVEIVAGFVQEVTNCDLKPMNDFHISLTKTVVLKHHWINPFIESIKQNVTHVSRFALVFYNLKVYCNEERTRTFIGLETKTGLHTLNKLVKTLDKCLQEFNLPTFYENPSFHMSITWCVGDHEEELNARLPEFNIYFQELLCKSYTENLFTYAQHLHCKSGNKLFSFNLI